MIAKLMKTKDKDQKYPKFSLNIQLGTDTKSKLIYGVNAIQNPTDHYPNSSINESNPH